VTLAAEVATAREWYELLSRTGAGGFPSDPRCPGGASRAGGAAGDDDAGAAGKGADQRDWTESECVQR